MCNNLLYIVYFCLFIGTNSNSMLLRSLITFLMSSTLEHCASRAHQDAC